MPATEEKQNSCPNSDTSGEIIPSAPDNRDMTREDRRRIVLQFLADHGLALPQRVIYRNLKLHQGITFGYSTVDNYLDDFVEEGLVRRINPKDLDDLPAELIDMPGGKKNRAYYIITEAGLAEV
jgi:hypothetical protein